MELRVLSMAYSATTQTRQISRLPVLDLEMTRAGDFFIFVAALLDPSAISRAMMLRHFRVDRHRSILADDDAEHLWSWIAHDVPSPHARVTLNEVIETVSPAVIAVVLKFRSAPDVAQLP